MQICNFAQRKKKIETECWTLLLSDEMRHKQHWEKSMDIIGAILGSD